MPCRPSCRATGGRLRGLSYHRRVQGPRQANLQPRPDPVSPARAPCGRVLRQVPRFQYGAGEEAGIRRLLQLPPGCPCRHGDAGGKGSRLRVMSRRVGLPAFHVHSRTASLGEISSGRETRRGRLRLLPSAGRHGRGATWDRARRHATGIRSLPRLSRGRPWRSIVEPDGPRRLCVLPRGDGVEAESI